MKYLYSFRKNSLYKLGQISQSKYSKAYKDHAEEVHRLNIFVNNLEFISEHNQRYESGEVSYRMAINKFSDLTAQEFLQLTGLGKNDHPESLRYGIICYLNYSLKAFFYGLQIK